QTFVTIPGTLRDHPDNLSLAGDGFDTVIKVSCADILTMATR
uniref:Peroxidase 3 (Fragments) n=1 Tax=Vitis vinifera TaxID=29760 RepID=PER3_VITVI|nr:RecName: Full=Peroxidase 3 [Vitis vinifera]